jgi:succinate-semialdehyde dehydrogenase/glutarate-semialdehyde dehydrogenase
MGPTSLNDLKRKDLF